MNAMLPGRVASAVLPLGLPPTSLPLLLGAMASGEETAVLAVPGVTPVIVQAALTATKFTYAAAFR